MVTQARSFSFDSTCSLLGPSLPAFDERSVKSEPMLFSCSWQAARSLGGPITQSFMDALAQTLRWDVLSDNIVIDSRVHMLMPGWFPCIPGWHHDDVPRERSDGQPDYVSPSYRSEHVMALVNGDICPTEFALGRCELPDVPLGGVFYRTWHPIVEELVRHARLSLWEVPTNRLVFFDWQALHQGTRARAAGWRWFVRASRRTGRKTTNETRAQVQVYMDRPMDGW